MLLFLIPLLVVLYIVIGLTAFKVTYSLERKRTIDLFAKRNKYDTSRCLSYYHKHDSGCFSNPVEHYNDAWRTWDRCVAAAVGALWPIGIPARVAYRCVTEFTLGMDRSTIAQSSYEKELDLKKREQNIRDMEKELKIGEAV